MSKVDVSHKHFFALALQLDAVWRERPDCGQDLNLGQCVAAVADLLIGKEIAVKNPQANVSDHDWLPVSLRESLTAAATSFVHFHKTRLQKQGLERVSAPGLKAFFLSALYEAMRFDLTDQFAVNLDNDFVSRRRPKRAGAAYFTPPSLAYLAAFRALSMYFEDKNNLPLICDPAMGTGLYLVAALDYLAIQKPNLSRGDLATTCLLGMDLDAATCSVAAQCLAVAIADERDKYPESKPTLLWADTLDGEFPKADIVLCNPPWDIVKKIRSSSGKVVPSRVNKARIASLRQNFIYQSEGDTSYYKIFLERCYQLLKPGGVTSILVPASFCGDKGAAALRALLLDHCQWQSIDGFINEDGAFAIHPQFKYLLLSFKKQAFTQCIQTRFGLMAKSSVLVLESAENHQQLSCHRNQLQTLGGPSRAILEVSDARDLTILNHLYQNHTPLRSFINDRGYFFRREFDMTLDRHQFVTTKALGQTLPRYKFERDEDWQGCFLPLLEGSMVGQFEPFKKSSETRYFIKAVDYLNRVTDGFAKVGFVSITSPYNTRSMIASLLPDLPAANSLPVLVFKSAGDNSMPAQKEALFTCAIFNSFVFDWMLRLRLTGNNLSYHVLEDLPFVAPEKVSPELFDVIVSLSALLSRQNNRKGAEPSEINSSEHTIQIRVLLELCILKAFGISTAQADYILRDCQYPAEVLAKRRRLTRDLNRDDFLHTNNGPDQRSFFRVDKTLPAVRRLPNLVKEAYLKSQNSPGQFSQDIRELEKPLFNCFATTSSGIY